MPTLLPEWKQLIKGAWSFRLASLSALLSAAEFGVQYLAPEHTSMGFALGAAVLSFAAAVARIVAQPELWKDTEQQPDA